MNEYLVLFAVVLAVNLMPAFGPPTWSIIVLFGFNTELPLAGMVLTGATAAAIGRYCLALGFRWLGSRISEERRANLAALRAAIERRKHAGFIGLALFALSPLPSAQLFAAAGLTGVRLLPFTLAFFAGRLVSYSIYAGSAQLLQASTLGDTFMETLRSPWGIALQVVMLAGLVALVRIDWAKRFGPAPEHDDAP